MTQICGSCIHWAQGAQGEPEYGTCQAIKHHDESEATALAFAQDTSGLGNAWLETRSSFGCVLWTAPSEAS